MTHIDQKQHDQAFSNLYHIQGDTFSESEKHEVQHLSAQGSSGEEFMHKAPSFHKCEAHSAEESNAH